MSDYNLLLALIAEYLDELDRRKRGVPWSWWNDEKKCYTETMVAPNNKARLTRLRLEISRKMLEIEKQMAQGGEKETWY